MFDQMSHAYSQMQPGDKMVMQLHKSAKPPTPQYRLPGAPAGGMGVAGPEVPQAGPGILSNPNGPMLGAPGAGLDGAAAPGLVDPMAERQAMIGALARMAGRQV